MSIRIQVLGHIWQPGFEYCATDYTMPDADVAQYGCDRDAIRNWLDCHAGDFQSLTDFAAYGDGPQAYYPVDIPWANEESEVFYNECMYPMPEEEYA